MDISDTLAPNSDQLDAVDLLGGPQTFTVDHVTKGNAEQPIQIHFREFPRPWRPGVNQRRVLGNVWGTESAAWAGRRLTLYCDQEVAYGGQKVGGIRVSHMSDITKRTGTPIIPTRGKSTIYNVDPLRETTTAPAAPSPTAALLAEIKTAADAAGVDVATIATEWAESHDGEHIKDATDLGALELIRDDLRGRAS